MSWTDLDRTNSYSLIMRKINGDIIDELTGFIVDSGSVTYDYYTDTRRIASFQTFNDNYVDNSLIEITVTTNAGDYESLGTFCVTDIEEQKTQTGTIKSYSLASCAYKLKTSFTTYRAHYTNLQQLWTIMGLIDDGFIHFSAIQGVDKRTHNYGEDGWVIEAGTDRLSTLVTLCDDYNVRYEPKEYTIQVGPYVRPATKPSTFEISLENGTTSGDITTDDTSLSTINRAIVKYTNNDITLVGVATASSSSPVAPDKRGQYVCQVFDVKSLYPESQYGADKLAKDKLAQTMPTKTYKVNGIYLGKHEGDVGTLIIDNETHKVMISQLVVNLNASMSCSYELKEVYND